MALPIHQHHFERVHLFQQPEHYGPPICTPSNFPFFKFCRLGYLLLCFRSSTVVLAPARFSLALLRFLLAPIIF